MINQGIEHALESFEKEDYKNCVEILVGCYNAGIQQDWIEEFFYSNFISPNDEEFRVAFNSVNKWGMKYEQCPVDFIPVSENEYYMFDKNKKEFLGNITVEDYGSYTRQFESILLSGIWDLRLFLDAIQGKMYRYYYIIANEDIERFLSFLKVPQLGVFFRRMTVFEGDEEFCTFFRENSSEYIPRNVISMESDRYFEMLKSIHEERIRDIHSERNNVFVSICIPSYNRGNRAFESVSEILHLPYDSELEIVVSDNGSTERTEGYEEIKELSERDSRLVYVRLSENKRYYGNICNVISHASGKYIITLSDEDHINLPEFEKCLDFLYRHPDLGIGCFSGEGVNLIRRSNTCITDNVEKYLFAIGQNYVTGLTLNNDALKQAGALDTIKKMDDNRFVVLYTHCALATISVKDHNAYISDIELCIEGRTEDINKSDDKREFMLPSYMYPQDRLLQLRGIMDFVSEVINVTLDEFMVLMFARMNEAYRYLVLLFWHHGPIITKEMSWGNAIKTMYLGIRDYIDGYKEKIPENAISSLHQNNESYFFSYFEQNPIDRYCNSKEAISEFKITYMMMKYLNALGKHIEDLDYDVIEKNWKEALREVE